MAGTALKCDFLFAVAALLYRWNTPDSQIRAVPDDEYDYIIVGSGSAGGILAARLSAAQNQRFRVLVLEAGDEETSTSDYDYPALTSSRWSGKMSWGYYTTPQKNGCQGMKRKRCFWPAGKVLGGSTTINGMVYVRGSRHDYDAWAKMGCDGWSYVDVLPYFKKSENNQNPQYRNSPYHGTAGPMYVGDVNDSQIVTDLFLKAAEEVGYRVGDINGEEQDGFSHMQATMVNGVRYGTAKAYIRPAMYNQNLHITTKALVSKIIFKGLRAIGVEYLQLDDKPHKSEKRVVRARKEVILAAGAIKSPQLLMLSGVGPSRHLEQHGIPVIVDLPSVGDNLQDHPNIFAPQFILNQSVSRNPLSMASSLQYWILGGGSLATPATTMGNAFLRSKQQPSEDLFPYIQLQIFNSLPGTSKQAMLAVSKMSNNDVDLLQALNGGHDGRSGISFIPILLHSKSRGRVTLASTDIMDHPNIDPNYLADPKDVEILLEGVRIIQKLAQTKAFEAFGAKQTDNVHPACRAFKLDSDNYWRCYIRQQSSTIFHPVGTCKMGRVEDESTVVDPNLRVKGVEGLRVADASIMPLIPSGNTNAASLMIGEKAADIILEGQN